MKESDTKCDTSVDIGKAVIGNDGPMTIPVNGYLAVYLSNATSFAQCEGCLNSEGDVYFDKLKIKFTRGNLKEETHYYPFGLPMAAIGSSAMGMTPNRQKYQSNEYITDAGLNWMSFGARQYDPQLGRFLSVDPMAAIGGQDMLSPYHAMGNNPVSMADPGGMQPIMRQRPTIPPINPFAHPIVSWADPGFGGFTPETRREMTPGFMPDTDPMNIGAWMDAAANEQSTKEFWNGVMDALDKLAPGSAQNIYNDGYGKFSFGLVYNLGPSNNSGQMFSNGSTIQAPNSGGSGTNTGYSSTYTKISNYSDAYGSITTVVSSTISFVDKSRYSSLQAMNYISGIAKGMGKVGDGLTVGYDIVENYQMYVGGLPNYIKPSPWEKTVTDAYFIRIAIGGELPGIVISGFYFLVVRSMIWNGYSNLGTYSPVPSIDNVRVNPPVMK